LPIYSPINTDYVLKAVDGKKIKLLKKAKYDSFGLGLLGLGDISQASNSVEAIAAVYDLEGFTNFCKQIDPKLSVPLFLSRFLAWLLGDIKNEMTRTKYEEGLSLWCPLPFLVKFLGDGLLVLWDVSAAGDIARRNIVLSNRQTCQHYVAKFFPSIRDKVVDPPPVLRCGVAMGTVYSVGNGNDYVGSCINMAARIQKLPGLTFAFNRRGFDLDDPGSDAFFQKQIVVKRIAIRGIGDNELIGILNKEYQSMSARERKLFRDV
jgi:hypothetical protein